MRISIASVALVAATLCAAPALAVTLTFDSPVVTGPSPAPGVWYTDRYNPAGFQTTFFDGDNRLKHSISAADGASLRPGAFSSAFYDTQGRTFDNPAGTILMSIDLYVPSDWASTGRRMAGFWGTAVNTSNAISRYPIIEFTSSGGVPRFRGWDNGIWLDMGLPTGFSYDAWHTLQIGLNGDGSFTYLVGDLSITTATSSSVAIDNVILQGYNTTEGVTYDIYWDNYRASPVPLPSAALAGLALLAPMGLTRNRRA